MTPIIIVLVIVVLLVIIFVGMYNGFIRRRNQVREALADIDVQLKRRYDLIPNLVETVKGYANFERSTLDAVIEARGKAMSTGSGTDAHASAAAENQLSGTLKSLFALSENYPDLKANASFVELQNELSDTENKIQAARRFYNSNVRDWNTAIQMFPGSMIAGMFGFTAADLYDLDENPEQRENVKVAF
jgi:LemA protein